MDHVHHLPLRPGNALLDMLHSLQDDLDAHFVDEKPIVFSALQNRACLLLAIVMAHSLFA